MGMIKHSVGFNIPFDIKRQSYLAHVRTILEYCSPLWSPSHVQDIIKLGRVQRQGARFILSDYVSPYHERCTELCILPFCFSGEIIDLCSVYSYFHGELSYDYASNFELILIMASDQLNRVCYSNYLCVTLQFQCSYFYRTARLWNTFILLSELLIACTFLRRTSMNYISPWWIHLMWIIGVPGARLVLV